MPITIQITLLGVSKPSSISVIIYFSINLWSYSKCLHCNAHLYHSLLYLLTCAVDRLAAVVTVKKLAVEQLNCNDSKDEMKQYVHDKYIDNVLQRIHYTVEHSLELGYALDGLQRSQNSQHAERLDGRQVCADGTAAVTKMNTPHS